MLNFFFLKQKTAYERRISDWSTDVCSSETASAPAPTGDAAAAAGGCTTCTATRRHPKVAASSAATISARSLPSDPSTPTTMAPPDPFENTLKIAGPRTPGRGPNGPDRKSGGEGKRVSVRGEHGGGP